MLTDFRAGNDGSQTIAHWLQGHYCQGDCMVNGGSTYNSVQDNLNCQATVSGGNYQQYFQAFINTNGPVAPSPAIFVPIGCDFAMPFTQLTVWVDEWNANDFNSTGVYAVAGTYELYMALLMAYEDENSVLRTRTWHGTTPQTNFQPAPYWTGFYASRTFLKQLHDHTTKLLIATEAAATLSMLAGSNSWQSELYAAWHYLVPSTHHDFITGTALDHVYDGSEDGVNGEQLVTLQNAFASAENLLSKALNQYSGWGAGQTLYFNSLGFPIDAVIEVDGEWTTASIPAFGWVIPSSANKDDWYVPVKQPVKARKLDATSYQLTNAFLSATITNDPLNGWVISSLVDMENGNNVLAGDANVLSFWNDQGGTIYRFAFEVNGGDCTFEACKTTITSSTGGIAVSNDLFTTFSGNMTFSITANQGTISIPFQVNYTLYHDSAALQVQVTGSTPFQTSIFTQIPLASTAATVEFGTTYHWETKEPSNFGPVDSTQQVSPAFDAVHDFIIPTTVNGEPILAVYMDAIRGWGVEPETNTLYGVLMRNNWESSPSCMGQGANGFDTAYHTSNFAIRVPTGLGPASTGLPRLEALVFNTPPYAVIGTGSGSLPSTGSLANVLGNSPVQITVVKPGSYNPSLVAIRLYNPTNSPQSVQVQFNTLQSVQGAGYATALEVPQPGPGPTIDGNVITVNCSFALTTVLIQP